MGLLFKIGMLILLVSSFCRYGDCAAYNSYGKRDPFVPLVGAAAQSNVTGLSAISSIDDISLQGVVVDADGRKAVIINGEIMREGVQIGNLTVESIGENDVVVRLNDVKYTLKLYK